MATQIFLYVHPYLEKWSNLTNSYVSNGLVQPPTSKYHLPSLVFWGLSGVFEVPSHHLPWTWLRWRTFVHPTEGKLMMTWKGWRRPRPATYHGELVMPAKSWAVLLVPVKIGGVKLFPCHNGKVFWYSNSLWFTLVRFYLRAPAQANCLKKIEGELNHLPKSIRTITQ